MHKRILIVEDETSIREMIAFALRKAGMETMQAVDARAAQLGIRAGDQVRAPELARH